VNLQQQIETIQRIAELERLRATATNHQLRAVADNFNNELTTLVDSLRAATTESQV
jgi:hypothetical protein